MLRSALTLSILTGRPIRLVNIRARRPKPGLMPQHLKAVEAATAIAEAHVDGAAPGSRTLHFEPRAIRSGTFRFDIGTAGSTCLVLQTVLLPLSLAATESRVTVTGGTHVPWSPCFDYLQRHWLHVMRAIGIRADVRLERAGFFPRGGGCVHAQVLPAPTLSPVELTERGPLCRIRGISAVANLDLGIAERQRRQAFHRLVERCHDVAIEIATLPARSPGTVLLLLAEFAHSQCCYYALGARGKPAERVADEAVDQLEAFLGTDGAIDEHLADQLVLPLACAAGTSTLRTAAVTQHLVTNAEVVRAFLPIGIQIDGDLGRPGTVRLEGAGLLSATPSY